MKTTALLLLLLVPFSLLGVLGLRLDLLCCACHLNLYFGPTYYVILFVLGYLILVCCVLLFVYIGCQFE